MSLPGSILPLEFFSRVSTTAFSRVVVSVTTLLYLAMALIPFLPDSETRLGNAEYRENSINQGAKK